MSVVVCRADGTGVVLVAARIVVCSFNVDEDALRCWVDGAVAVPGGGFVSCCSFELDEDAFDSVTRVTLSIKKLGQTLASSAASPASKISSKTVNELSKLHWSCAEMQHQLHRLPGEFKLLRIS